MPATFFVCPHCEQHAEVQVTSVTRSRTCPSCGEVVVLQVPGKDKKSKRRAILIFSDEAPAPASAPVPEPTVPGFSGAEAFAQPIDGDVVERLKFDPEVRQLRKRLVIGAVTIVAAVLLTTLWHFYGGDFQGSAAFGNEDPAPRAPGPVVTTQENSRLTFTPKTAGETFQQLTSSKTQIQLVERFLKATTVEDLLALVADVSAVEPAIRDHVARHPLAPIKYKDISAPTSANEHAGEQLVKVTLADGQQREVYLIEENGQPRVDWPSTVAWSEMEWSDFMTRKPTAPVVFRVLADEEGRYDNAFASKTMFRCLRLRDPANPASPPLYAYVERSSVLGSELDFLLRQLPELPAKLTLRLKYPTDATVPDQVWLDKVVTAGWVVR